MAKSKSTALPNTVLTGTGGGGSFSVTVPPVTPGIGPAAGTDASLSTEIHPGPVSPKSGE